MAQKKTKKAQGKKSKSTRAKQPKRKNGVSTILAALRGEDELTLDQIVKFAEKKLGLKFSNAIPLYEEAVKLDLQARKTIREIYRILR